MNSDLERAEDVNTPPADLERLALSRDARVRERVAANPNAGLGTLQRLMVRHAGAVLENEILDFLGLEDANWFAGLPAWARAALLRDPACPSAWLRAALFGASVDDALAAAQNPVLPAALIAQIIAGEAVVGEALHLHRAAPPVDAGTLEARRVQAGLRLERDVETLKDATAAGLVEPWVLEVCARGEDLDLALLAARHPRTGAAVLEGLAFHADSDVRAAVLARTLPEGLRDLLERSTGVVSGEDGARLLPYAHGRWLVARHSSDPAQLEAVSADPDWRVRQASAQNPNLSGARLAALAQDVDKDVRAAVAAHPRTPRSALARLMLDADADVCGAARANENAPRALETSLRKLETGDATLSAAALERLSRRDERLAQLAAAHVNASAGLLRALATHADWHVRQNVARHPRTESNVLETLALDSDYDVRAAVALHARAGVTLLEAAARDAHPLVRSAVALSAQTPVALLERLALDSDHDVRSAVAVNPRCGLTVLEGLCGDAHEGVRRAVALHPRTSGALLERLSNDSDADVRAMVADHANATLECAPGLFGAAFAWQDLYARVRAAGDVSAAELRFLAGLNAFGVSLALHHPHCPPDVLERFAGDETWTVRQRVAAHPRAAGALLEHLSVDSDHDVRSAVAAHPQAERALIARLASDDSSTVRAAVAERTDLEPDVLERLAWDPDEAVVSALGVRAEHAARLRERPRAQALSADERARLQRIGTVTALELVARDPETDAAALRDLCAHADWRVRVGVAGHARSDAETLEVLTSDHDSDVRRALASNPATPGALVARLLADHDQSVVRAALEHPQLDPALRAARRRAILTRLLVGRGLNRVLALGAPELALAEFAKQRNLHAASWLERLALAGNPSAPRGALELLARDANQFVSALARQRLGTA